MMDQFPSPNVTRHCPFLNSGVDYAGLFLLRIWPRIPHIQGISHSFRFLRDVGRSFKPHNRLFDARISRCILSPCESPRILSDFAKRLRPISSARTLNYVASSPLLPKNGSNSPVFSPLMACDMAVQSVLCSIFRWQMRGCCEVDEVSPEEDHRPNFINLREIQHNSRQRRDRAQFTGLMPAVKRFF